MFDWLISNWEGILILISAIVTISSIIVKWTPTPKDDKILAKVLKFLELLSLNKKVK